MDHAETIWQQARVKAYGIERRLQSDRPQSDRPQSDSDEESAPF
jgi:hypothetical protein